MTPTSSSSSHRQPPKPKSGLVRGYVRNEKKMRTSREYSKSFATLRDSTPGALGALLLPKILQYEKAQDLKESLDTEGFSIGLKHIYRLVQGKRSVFRANHAKRFSEVFGIPVEQLQAAYNQDAKKYASLRSSNFPDLMADAGHLGRLVLPAMERKDRTIISIINELEIDRERFRELMRGEQTFFRKYKSVAEVVIRLAALLDENELEFLKAYIADASNYYDDLLLILHAVEQSAYALSLPSLEGKSEREQLARLVYMLTIARQVRDEDWPRLQGVIQAFVQPQQQKEK